MDKCSRVKNILKEEILEENWKTILKLTLFWQGTDADYSLKKNGNKMQF